MPSVSDKHSVIPVLLLILDGVGCRDAAPDNPVSLPAKPNWDRLWREFAHTTIDASERSVGTARAARWATPKSGISISARAG